MSAIREYIKLIRPYGILFIGFTPVFGAICNGAFEITHLFLLLLIGLLGHIFVFVQNDYYDIEVDRQSKYVMQRPLTSGMVSRTQALLLFLGSFLLSVGLASIFFFSVLSLLVLFFAFFLMTLYNRYSKRVTGMEYVLGISVFLYGIYGALTVSGQVSLFAVLISSAACLQWVFSVGVSANLKDVEFDTKLGIRTTPVLLGVQALGTHLKKPAVFLLYVYTIQLLHLMLVILPIILGYTSPTLAGYPLPLLAFLILASLLLYTTKGILQAPLDRRDQMLRYEGIHEGLALLLIPCVLLNYLVEHLGVLFTVSLLVVLILWPLLCLRVLYGKKLIPLE